MTKVMGFFYLTFFNNAIYLTAHAHPCACGISASMHVNVVTTLQEQKLNRGSVSDTGPVGARFMDEPSKVGHFLVRSPSLRTSLRTRVLSRNKYILVQIPVLS